jgi:AcrR family transcriptional regulator
VSARERNKQRTRESIVDAAYRLFHEQGFDATTVTEIADAAGIGRRTFFSYFPSKEAVVFDGVPELLEDLERTLDARDTDESFLVPLGRWLRELIESGLPTDPRHLDRRRLVEATPELRESERRVVASAEATLTRVAAEQLGVDPGAVGPRLAAAAVTASLLVLLPADVDDAGAWPAEGLRRLDATLAFLAAGIDALSAPAAVS